MGERQYKQGQQWGMTDAIEMRLQKMIDDIQQIETEVSRKADEVVSYQVLQHRQDIERILGKLSELEARLEKIESKQVEVRADPSHQVLAFQNNKKRKISRLFSFLH